MDGEINLLRSCFVDHGVLRTKHVNFVDIPKHTPSQSSDNINGHDCSLRLPPVDEPLDGFDCASSITISQIVKAPVPKALTESTFYGQKSLEKNSPQSDEYLEYLETLFSDDGEQNNPENPAESQNDNDNVIEPENLIDCNEFLQSKSSPTQKNAIDAWLENDSEAYYAKIQALHDKINDRYDNLGTCFLKQIDMYIVGKEEKLSTFSIKSTDPNNLENIENTLKNKYKNTQVEVKACNDYFFQYFGCVNTMAIDKSYTVSKVLVEQKLLEKLKKDVKSEGGTWMLEQCGDQLVGATGVLGLCLLGVITILVLAGPQAIITLPVAAMISLITVASILALAMYSTAAVVALRYRFFTQAHAEKQDFLQLVTPLCAP